MAGLCAFDTSTFNFLAVFSLNVTTLHVVGTKIIISMEKTFVAIITYFYGIGDVVI